MTNAVIEYGQALYYPHVRFRSRQWLRTSLLYHDKIWRIVPPGLDDYELELGYGLPDSKIIDEIRALRSEGIIENEVVSPVVTKVSADFTEFVKANLTDPARRKELIPELSADQQYQWYRIHPGKLDPTLRDLLHDLHLAREVPHDHHGDWDLDITTGGMYMYFLAQALAKNRPIISDSPKFQALAYAPPDLGLNRRGVDVDKGFMLAVASFETVHPLGIEHVPVGKLIKFREDHQEERTRFHLEVAKLAKDLSSIDHADQVSDALEPHVKIVKENTKILQRKINALGLDCARNIFTFSVPGWAVAAAAARAILPTNPYLLAGAGVLSVGFTLAKYRLDRKNLRGESPWSYLLSLRNDITPRRATKDLITLSLSGTPKEE
jgi:hypothetical protein